ncbi:hypothetical protein PIB30_087131, partial [Stylosanthes scabra]|nr:hypothetical protein [Stylosanthes scabra]
IETGSILELVVSGSVIAAAPRTQEELAQSSGGNHSYHLRETRSHRGSNQCAAGVQAVADHLHGSVHMARHPHESLWVSQVHGLPLELAVPPYHTAELWSRRRTNRLIPSELGYLHVIRTCGSGLQRLRLNKCFERISSKGLRGLAQKFPLLEELDITLCFRLTAIFIESFGQACPLLKTFKFNHPRPYYFYPNHGDYVDNAYAFSIALSMPKLRHLQLIGNWLDNDGLLAILNGCPYLESIDLGYCFNLDVTPTLMMLMQGIMDLRLPAVPPAKLVHLLPSYEEVIWEYNDYNFLVEQWHMYQDGIKNAKQKKGMFGGQRYDMGHYKEEATREDWEEIYDIWECAKNQRSRKASKRYLREKKKKNGKLKGKKKHRRKEGALITTKTYVLCFEMEETENSLRYQ